MKLNRFFIGLLFLVPLSMVAQDFKTIPTTPASNDVEILVGKPNGAVTNARKTTLGNIKDSFWIPYPTVVSGLVETNNAVVFRGKRVNETSGRVSYVDMSGKRWTIDSISGGSSGAVTSVNGSTGAVTVQPTLISGTNIKSINGNSILGSGNLAVSGSGAATDFSFISDTIIAFGLAANESVTNYSYTSINALYSKFNTAPTWTSGTDYGGWLANGTSGDSVAISAPFGVIIGDSQAEGHPSQHGRLHVAGAATFTPAYDDVAGTPSYHLRQLTKMKWFNHGIGSQTSTDVLNRFDRDVLGLTVAVGDGRGSKTLERKPSIAIIVVGINDFYSGFTTTLTKSNLTTMAQKCAQNGIYCVMLNVPGDEIITETQAKQVDSINIWLKNGALNPYGTVIIDYNTWWRDPAYNDNAHGNSLIADDIHPSAVGYDSLSQYIFNSAKLPILTKAYVYNEIAPTSAITGFSRPNSIRVDKLTTYGLSGVIDSFTVTTPLRNDSIYFAILASTNVSGTSLSGFSHIRWLLTNGYNNSLKREKYFVTPLTTADKWSEVGGRIYPSIIGNAVAIGATTLHSSTNLFSLKSSLNTGNEIFSVANSTNTDIFSIVDNNRVNINGGGSGYNFNVNGQAAFNNGGGYTFISGGLYQMFGSPAIDFQSTAVNTGGSGFTELRFNYDGANLNYYPHSTRGANFKVLYNKLGGSTAVSIDAINSRIGVGTGSPTTELHIVGQAKFGGGNNIYMNVGQSSVNSYPEFNYNAKFTGTLGNYTREIADEAFRFSWKTGGFEIATASSSTAGSVITFTKQMDMVNGNLMIGAGSPSVKVDINATDGIKIPVGTDAQRPSAPTNGMMRFNTTSNVYEGYCSTCTTAGWKPISVNN